LDKQDAFHAALGRFLLAWADVEFGLDHIVLLTPEIQNKQHKRKHLPHQLAAKIGYVKEQCELLAPLRRRKVEIETVLGEIEGLAVTRHDLVHGAVIDQWEGRISVTAMMGRHLQPPNKKRPIVRVTTKEIIETALRTEALANRVSMLWESLTLEPEFSHIPD
jgi:hypothetical protein